MSLRKNSKRRPVKAVGTGLDRGVDDAALILAELSRRVLRDQVELLNRIHAGLVSDFVVDVFLVVYTIKQERIGLLTVAIDVGPARTRHGLRLRQGLRIHHRDPRRQQRQLNVVARGQGQAGIGLGVNDGADLGALRLQKRGRRDTSTVSVTCPTFMGTSIRAVWFSTSVKAGCTAV